MLLATLLTLACAAAHPANVERNDADAALPRAVLGELPLNHAVDSNVLHSSHHGKRQTAPNLPRTEPDLDDDLAALLSSLDSLDRGPFAAEFPSDGPPGPDEEVKLNGTGVVTVEFEAQQLNDLKALMLIGQAKADNAAIAAAHARFLLTNVLRSSQHGKRQTAPMPPIAGCDLEDSLSGLPDLPGIMPPLPLRLPGDGHPVRDVSGGDPGKITSDIQDMVKAAIEKLHTSQSLEDALAYTQQLAAQLAKLAAVQAGTQLRIRTPEEV